MAGGRDEGLKSFEIPLDGKLRTADDSVTIGRNFKSLINLRYGDFNLKGIGGMSKINTTALTTYLKIRNGIHFKKGQPEEDHIVVQAYNADLTASQVLENTTIPPTAGDFSGTALHTDSSGAKDGRFSQAPGGSMAYCNGVDTMIWSGDESPIGSFLNYEDSDDTQYHNFTEPLMNTLQAVPHIAVLVNENSKCSIYLGTTRPIAGIKFYVKTANTATATTAVKYWSGSAWTSVSNFSDGTLVSGKTLAQTGSMTFDSTISVAKPRIIEQQVLYWYQIQTSANLAGSPTLYYVTVDKPFQTVKDVWDGADRYIAAAFLLFDGGLYDVVIDVYKRDYNESIGSTFAQLNNATTSDIFHLGFVDRVNGFYLGVRARNDNTANLSVEYWNGSTWTAVSNLIDKTSTSGKTFNKSGIVSWNQISAGVESKRTMSGGMPLYYYRVKWSATLSIIVHLDYIYGVPTPKDIRGYSFPFYSRNRLWLCDNTDNYRNSAICSAASAPDVWNGADTITLYFGDEKPLTAAVDLYSRLGSSIYDIALFFKESELWGLTGDNPNNFIQYRVSSKIGCVAPKTLHTTTVATPDGNSRPIAIWQGADGIYMFDNSSIIPIHEDIKNLFDKRDTSVTINADKIAASVGFIDEQNKEYHWLFASGNSTTLNKEFVFDLRRLRWYEIDRGTGKALQFGMTVYGTDGLSYNYGTIDTGYMERLESGNGFDGTAIAHTLEFGDFPFHENEATIESMIRKVRLLMVAKSTTDQVVAVTHYGDTATTGTSFTLSPADSSHRVAQPMHSDRLGPCTFHRFKFTISTDDEIVGFEPLALVGFYKIIRKSTL